MIGTRTRTLLAAVCVSAGAVFASQAPAQNATQPVQPSAEAPAVSDEKLQSFVVALAEVQKVKQEYGQRLQTSSDESEQQEIRNEAGQQMLQAVEQTDGISVDEYNQIIRSAQADPELAQRLNGMMGTPQQ